MKKLLLIVALVLTMSTYVVPVFAETTETGSVFEEKVLPYITMGGTGIGGALAVVLGFMRSTKTKTDKITAGVKDATDELSTKFTNGITLLESGTAELKKTETELKEGIESVNKGVTSFTDSANKTILELKAATEASQAEVKSLKTDIVNIKDEQSKTLQAILIAFTNDTELVKNGFAAKIAAIMKVGAVVEATETAQTQN
jgi:hypothetical protein